MANESSFRNCLKQKGVEKVTKFDVKASIFKICFAEKTIEKLPTKSK